MIKKMEMEKWKLGAILYNIRHRSTNNLLSALQRRLRLLKDSFDRESLHDTEHNTALINADIDKIIENQVEGA